MAMLGFTAEASLYKSALHYCESADNSLLTGAGGVQMAAKRAAAGEAATRKRTTAGKAARVEDPVGTCYPQERCAGANVGQMTWRECDNKHRASKDNKLWCWRLGLSRFPIPGHCRERISELNCRSEPRCVGKNNGQPFTNPDTGRRGHCVCAPQFDCKKKVFADGTEIMDCCCKFRAFA